MKAQHLLGSPPFILLGVVIARTLPRRFGYWLARCIARGMRRRRSHMFATVRANLRQVVGEASPDRLDDMAESAIYHAGCTYVDMFRLRRRDLTGNRISLRSSPEALQAVRGALADRRGLIIVGTHMSNFDLATQWLAAQSIEIQVLGLAGPNAGTRTLNRIRGSRGMVVTPMGVDALRAAVRRLKNGGAVLFGVDRPVSPDDELLPFFGRPAPMPTGHIRLALQTNARIVVASCIQEASGRYAVLISSPIELERTYDRHEDVRRNAIRVLQMLEEMIRQAPEQWLMFVPVWPEDAG